MKLKRTITFTKELGKKIINQNNEDQIRKHIIINFNWKMNLKTIKTFTKKSKKKIEIQRIITTLDNIIFDKLELKNKIENR